MNRKNDKTLNTVEVHIETDLDADDLGNRIVTAAKSIDPDYRVVNLIKVHLSDNLPCEHASKIMELMRETFHRQKCNNCIFVPIGLGINDVVIDTIEVTKNA